MRLTHPEPSSEETSSLMLGLAFGEHPPPAPNSQRSSGDGGRAVSDHIPQYDLRKMSSQAELSGRLNGCAAAQIAGRLPPQRPTAGVVLFQAETDSS